MRVLKWLGIGMLSIVGLVLVGVATVWAISGKKAAKTYEVTLAPLAIPTDSASIARGRHLTRAIGKCTECHGDDLGGTEFINASVFAVVPAPNLTRGRGGIGATYTDQDYVRVIRHGVMPSGRGAYIMPAEAFRYFSDDDLAAIIAYVKSVPPVDREWGDPKLGVIGRALLAFNQVPVFPAATFDQTRADVPPAPAVDTTPAYGGYLIRVGGCTSCHGENLSGRPPFNGDPSAKPSGNLTPGGIGEWTLADFTRVLREGKGIGGRDIDSTAMPWTGTREMSDLEIHATWNYLRSLPPKQFAELP